MFRCFVAQVRGPSGCCHADSFFAIDKVLGRLQISEQTSEHILELRSQIEDPGLLWRLSRGRQGPIAQWDRREVRLDEKGLVNFREASITRWDRHDEKGLVNFREAFFS